MFNPKQLLCSKLENLCLVVIEHKIKVLLNKKVFLVDLVCYAVILSNYYDLPFNDIIDWRKFTLVLKESDVYQLKQILKDIPDAGFRTLHNNLVKVASNLFHVQDFFC